MKKGRCRGPQCLSPSIHFQVSVPGYDTNLTLFGENQCGTRPGTLFKDAAQSMTNGMWNIKYSSTAHASNVGRCDLLPAEFVDGCKLFSFWGWRTVAPARVRFRTVACPSNFSAWVGGQFSTEGAAPLPGLWYGAGMRLTHFWDCNGMGCDGTVLRNFRQENYIAAPGYAPQDPEMHGGSVYGESIWMVGAASDALAKILGPADDCCGFDYGSPGCGKCLLVQDPDAVQANWTAVVMKKSRCPPETNGCEWPNVHMDLAVPGFDVLGYSLSNVCSEKRGTVFTSKSESEALGLWYECEDCALSDSSVRSRCEFLPPEYIKPCQLFADWGWRSRRSSHNVRYKSVECPSRFISWVNEVFTPSGVAMSRSWPTTTTTTTATTTSTTTRTTSTTTSTTTTNNDTTTFLDRVVSSGSQGTLAQDDQDEMSLATIITLSVLGGICLLFSAIAFICMNALHCKLCRKSDDNVQWPDASNRRPPGHSATNRHSAGHSSADRHSPAHSITSCRHSPAHSIPSRNTPQHSPQSSTQNVQRTNHENLEFDL